MRAIGAPARLPAIVGDLDPARAVAVHVVDIADLVLALALIGDEADLAAIGRRLGIKLIDVLGFRESDGAGTVGVAQVELEIAVAVGFVDQLVAIGLELGQQLLDLTPIGSWASARARK